MPLPAWPEGAFRGDSFALSPPRCFCGLEKRVTESQGQPWLGRLCGVIVDKPPPALGSVFSGEGAEAGSGQGARGGGAGMHPPTLSLRKVSSFSERWASGDPCPLAASELG